MSTKATWRAAACVLLVLALAAPWALGNGGPFVVKYPGGDPAAKGVLARLDPSLKPAQETHLRVVKEDLAIRFGREPFPHGTADPPLVGVSAVYTIENPTDEEIQVDFGFPILRGIYVSPFAMMPTPDVNVRLDKEYVRPTVISNSAIYGLIRQNARELIEKGIADDAELWRLVAAVRGAWAAPKAEPPAAVQQAASQRAAPARTKTTSAASERWPTSAYLPACEALRNYLTAALGWNPRDAALMVQYASLEFGLRTDLWRSPRDCWEIYHWNAQEFDTLKRGNLGPLVAIGEQKATQLFAQLASRFDEKAGSNYEAIFAAWGGDVRERSVDLASGQLRPREISLPPPPAADGRPAKAADPYDRRLMADPTVFARVDYLDPNVKISPADKVSCEAILKNLPVTFTFAPMNLLYYQVKFPAHGTRVVAVEYKQYAYADTRGRGSYQLAYVLHPATLWRDFGPIHVTIAAPKGILCRASVPLRESGEVPPAERPETGLVVTLPSSTPASMMQAYQVALAGPEEMRGELFVGVDKTAWDAMFPPAKPKPAAPPPISDPKPKLPSGPAPVLEVPAPEPKPNPGNGPTPQPAGPNASDPFGR